MGADTSQIKELSIALHQVERDAMPLAEKVVRKVSLDTERDAKKAAPVDTGNLRNSISTTVTVGAANVTGEVGPTANYGHYVEYGTSRMNGQPYMTPAFEKNAPNMEKAGRQIGVLE